MSAIAEHPPMTAQALLALRDGEQFELVHGELAEKTMGWESEWIGTNLVALLWMHCRQHGGWVNGSSAGYRCFEESVPDDPDRVRKPDASYIAAHRLSPGELPTGHCELVPDLTVEVISPNDLYSEVEEKIDEYLRAGVRMVWVIDPHTESIRVHRLDGTVNDLRGDDELDGGNVVSGFRCPVRQIFAVPSPQAET